MYQNGGRTRGRTPLGVDVIRRRTPNHVRTVQTHRRSGCNGDLTSNSDAERVGKSQAGVSILAAQIRLFFIFIHRYPPSGKGVPQDDVEAVAWYRRAAEQGDQVLDAACIAGAQGALGYMYSTGRGVPQDDVEAYKWKSLAATYADASDRDRYAEFRDDAAERLTPQQRADAQRRAREFFEAHPPE